MNEFERLIDLLSKKMSNETAIRIVADYLFGNGLIVLPCKAGDVVYVVLLNKVFKFDIISVKLFQNGLLYRGKHGLNLSYTFRPSDIGKTVFLTREEAEKALKEREENGTAQT